MFFHCVDGSYSFYELSMQFNTVQLRPVGDAIWCLLLFFQTFWSCHAFRLVVLFFARPQLSHGATRLNQKELAHHGVAQNQPHRWSVELPVERGVFGGKH